MFKKVITSLFFGIVGTIFFAQYDSWTHQKIITWCKNSAFNSLQGNASFKVQSLNFFTPSLVITDLEMISLQPGDWSWKCKRCEVRGSWFQLFLKGFMDQHIVFDEFECTSRVENGVFAIEDHIVAMTHAPSVFVPTDLKSMRFRNSHMVWHDDQKEVVVSLFFNSSSLKIGNRFRTTMSINDGTVMHQDVLYGSSIAADISLSSWFDGDLFMYSMNCSGLFYVVHLGDHTSPLLHQGYGGPAARLRMASEQSECYVSGSLESGRGRFSVRNAYNSFVIDPIIITEREMRADFFVPLHYILCCMQKQESNNTIGGDVHGSLRLGRNEAGDLDGHIIVEDAMIAQRRVCDSAKIAFMRRNKLWKGRLGIAYDNQEYVGTGHWDESIQQGRCDIRNSRPLSVSVAPYWAIAPNNFLISAWFNNQESAGIFQGSAIHRLNNAHHCMQGGFSYGHDVLTVHSLMDAGEFDASCTLFPIIEFDHSNYYDQNKNRLFSLQRVEGEEKSFKGDISFAYIRSWINSFLHYDIQGEGMISVHGALSKDDIFADVTLHHDATIRLPETYNFIDGFKARVMYNRLHNSIVAQKIDVSLHTGTINCVQATALFDEEGKLFFVHAPVVFDRCLLNIKKDLFAIVSGGLLFSHNDDHQSRVSGSIIIDRAQLKENIFSAVIQKRLFDYTHSVFSLADRTVDCDLSIETKSPIRVDTAFLQTNAWVDLKIEKNIKDPAISGTITLQSGSLIFPYKPLYISKGILTFSPEQSFDPAIELIARNKIKKYDVLLQVAGTVLNHHIMLDSTPPLSEEQITTLLLVGSEESSLNSMIPALILQNLKNLIFTNNQSTFLEKYFAPLLRPFNISLMPSFADQAGRGGLRGILEISVDDRWKAIIQKNFSLTEDTRFELEFLVSDDIALRGIRDERRDLGGEVEMRWKF